MHSYMKQVRAPKSWNNLETHYQTVLTSEWYGVISKLQSQFVRSTQDFFNQKGFDFQMLPITTGGISSSMKYAMS